MPAPDDDRPVVALTAFEKQAMGRDGRGMPADWLSPRVCSVSTPPKQTLRPRKPMSALCQ